MNFEGTFIDLCQEIYTGMPVYPGHLKTIIFTHASHEEVKRAIGTGFSYQTSGILMCDHGPTHIDPVSHFSRDPTRHRSTRFRWNTASPRRCAST